MICYLTAIAGATFGWLFALWVTFALARWSFS
jgi:hypothetical protein